MSKKKILLPFSGKAPVSVSLRKQFDPVSLFMLTAAGIINAFGVVLFLSPVSLYDSGISGTSMLFAQLFADVISFPFFLIILNIPLFLYGLGVREAHLPAAPSTLSSFILWLPLSSGGTS